MTRKHKRYLFELKSDITIITLPCEYDVPNDGAVH